MKTRRRGLSRVLREWTGAGTVMQPAVRPRDDTGMTTGGDTVRDAVGEIYRWETCEVSFGGTRADMWKARAREYWKANDGWAEGQEPGRRQLMGVSAARGNSKKEGADLAATALWALATCPTQGNGEASGRGKAEVGGGLQLALASLMPFHDA